LEDVLDLGVTAEHSACDGAQELRVGESLLEGGGRDGGHGYIMVAAERAVGFTRLAGNRANRTQRREKTET
jgi:hypothetical protein